jgi:uncharacterized protein (TIGR00255 family)
MTGFGAATGLVGRARVHVEIRTVNHRFFNPSVKLPSAYSRWEGEVRETLRQHVTRGHVTLTARAESATDDAQGGIDETRFAAYVELLTALKSRHKLAGEVDLATVLRLPDVVVSTAPDADDADGIAAREGSAAGLVAVVDAAARALTAMREAEGARLAAYLGDRLRIVEDTVSRARERAPHRIVHQRDRLREAVRVLAEGVSVDPQRLAQEVAILADRLDISEEIDRLRAHIAAFRAALTAAGGEPVGKRLGFLMQEMLREANTVGSKAGDAEILHDVVLIKEELERIREQVDNLE